MSRRKKTASAGDTVSTGVTVTDAFSNPIFRLGYGTQAPLEATEYPLTRLTENYALLNSMYRSGGILQSVVDIIPGDMTREWFTVQGDISPEDLDAFEKTQRKIKLKDQIREGLKWGRLYGGAAGIMLIRGQENQLDKPLKIDSVLPESFKGLLILDRWSGVNPDAELVTDLNDPDFGLPKYYSINAADGRTTARVHHSRVVRFIGRELPFLEKIATMYWGESEIEPIFDDVRLYDSIMHNMGNLTFRANVDTMEVQNLDQLFAITSGEQQRRFWNMMQAQSVAESNFGMRLINKGDQVSNRQYTFAGFNYVTEAAQLNLCAKTHIPMTKLFGRSPAGMNATGESDMKNYYDIVDGEREAKLRPAIEKILPVLCMSCWGAVPEDINIQFPPLWTPNATEIANIAKTKTETVVTAFQSGMITLGAAQKELKRITEETGLFDSITNEEIEQNKGKSYRDVMALQDPTAGITPGADEDNPFDAADSVAMDGLGYNPYRDPVTGRFTTGNGLNSEANRDIIISGAISGGLNPNSKEAQKHADRYYELVKRMSTDVDSISRNTGFSREDIEYVKRYIFLEKHDLGGPELEYFDPSYRMAESWRRLIDGKDIQHHDIILIKHELMERDLILKGVSQTEAHNLTSLIYNYAEESNKYYAEINKHKNK